MAEGELRKGGTFEAIRNSVEREPYSRILGIRLVDLDLGHAVTEMEFSGDMKNVFGMAHGGAIFSLIDEAFGAAANSYGTVAVALNVNIVYVRPPSPGETLRAEATEINRTKRIPTYEIRVLGEDGELIATSQATAYRKGYPLPFSDEEVEGPR
jgi:acyl-CoA thioesterase